METAPNTHNQQTAAPNTQPIAERVLPATGAEFTAQFLDRMPNDCRDLLQEVALKFDTKIQSLAEPTEKEVTRVEEHYVRGRADAYGKVKRHAQYRPLITGEELFKPTHTLNDAVAEKLGSRIIHTPRSQSEFMQLMGPLLPSIDSSVKKLSEQVSGHFRKEAISKTRKAQDEWVDKREAHPPEDPKQVAKTAVTQYAEQKTEELGQKFHNIAKQLDETLPQNTRTGKLGRFLSTRAGSQVSSGAPAINMLRELSQAIDLATANPREILKLGEKLTAQEIESLQATLEQIARTNAASYENDALNYFDTAHGLNWAIETLKSMNHTVSVKLPKATPTHEQPVETSNTVFDARARSVIDIEVSELRSGGSSDRDVKWRLMAKYHPDIAGNDPAAAERFRYLNSLNLGKNR